jgi:REP element-mobilizing transposase RayT
MTAPRRILPGALTMVSRRCIFQMFLLKPSKLVNELLQYLLAVAAERYGIVLHAFCVLSNHLHIVLSDPKGNLPEFEQFLDSLIAKSLNALYGRWETFWAPGSYSAVTLVGPEDVLAKTAYVLANPVSAGLVRRGKEWPGLWSAPERIGAGPIEVKRPEFFFREGGSMPATAQLKLVCPPGFDSVETFRARLVAELTELEDRAARQHEAEGRAFLGARRVLAQSHNARPRPVARHRGLNPRIACRDKWKRIEAIGRLKQFLTEYRIAWQAFASGLRDVTFPAGTYWMRVAYGVPCAASG